MKPWINPKDRRARWYWTGQMLSVVVATVVLVAALLLDPGSGRGWWIPVVLVIGGVMFRGASSQRKRVAEEFRVGPPAEGRGLTRNT